MTTIEELPARICAAGTTRKPIASLPHLAGFIAIQVALVAGGAFYRFWFFGRSPWVNHIGLHSPVAIHVVLYLSAAIPIECGLLTYCWLGVRKRGGNLRTLSGGRWNSWSDLASDVGLAISSWVGLLGVNWIAARLLGSESVNYVSLVPKAIPEILAWIAVSVSAGICEELIYRGYLQQQLHALGGNLSLAVLAQGLIFGLMHSYQGWKSATVICVIGMLLGALAAWRKNLRANILVHTWVDIWEGWLKFAI